MSKICAKCDKPVYPTEELKCLDKVWHKACFKCWDCGMSLNMKNYKGYDKKPYCNAHYPQTKATVVAETPEIARLTTASKIQSQAKYHEEFEKKIKGSKIQVADDPETQRLKQVNAVISQVEYKGLKEKANEMETHRANVAQSEVTTRPDVVRPRSGVTDDNASSSNWSSPYSDRSTSYSTAYTAAGKVEAAPSTRKIGSIADYDPGAGSAPVRSAYQPIGVSMRPRQEWEETVPMTPSAPSSSDGTAVYTDAHRYPLQQDETDADNVVNRDNGAGSYVACDLNQQLVAQQQQQQQQLREQQLREQQLREQQQREQQQREQQLKEQQLREQQQREQQLKEQELLEQQMRDEEIRLQKLREEDDREMEELRQKEMEIRAEQIRERELRDQQANLPPVNLPPPSRNVFTLYQAMYDYEAQDDDEVGFNENDFIVDVELIDDGWMFGTVQRTGKRGMLPANYVERIQ